MGGEAVSAVRPGVKTQSAVASSVWFLSRRTGLKVGQRPRLRVQRISWRTNKRQTGVRIFKYISPVSFLLFVL